MALRLQRSVGPDGAASSGVGHRFAVVSIRAHPHMPRDKKSAKPLRDTGGNASPSVAMRRVSYSATMAESHGKHSAAVSATSAAFFSTDRTLDRPWVHIEVELLPYQPR
jgi:hypothetical protein